MADQITTLSMERKFKRTPAGEIPVDWGIAGISDVCNINPSKTEVAELGTNIPVAFVRMENVAEDARGISSFQSRKLGDLINRGYTYFKNGDVLFAKITPCMENGKIALARNLEGCMGFGSTEFHVLRPDLKKISADFLFYWVSRKSFRQFAARHFRGTAGQQRVQRDFFNAALIPIPPLQEQKKIAEILSAVDAAIDKAAAVVTKTKELKKGLMRLLLIRGIGHKKFKKTPAGEIPVDWEAKKLGDLADIRYGLGQPPVPDQNGVLMIRATNIKQDRIVENDMLRVSRETLPLSRNPFLKEGDIIVVRSGVNTGDVALITKVWAEAVAGYDLVLSPSSGIDSTYCLECLISERTRAYFLSQRERSAQPHLNAQQLFALPIALPPLGEQKKIADILSAVDETIEKTNAALGEIQALKKSLMQTLLTGKVRISL